MNRRTFFPCVSGSFFLGAIGGIGAGAAGTSKTLQAMESKYPSKRSFSQHGEDLVVDSIRKYVEHREFTYMDIGAADPVRINNTYFFYKLGCRGVLVEPNPACCQRLNAERPGDRVLNVGIGVTDEKEADFYLIGGMAGEDLNTFSKEMAESYSAKTGGVHSIEKVVKIPLVSINRVMDEQFQGAPVFMSIDTEGLDLQILETLDFGRLRPEIVCVETLVFGSNREDAKILAFMQAKGYVVRGSTFVNTIFVDEKLLA